MNQKEREKAFQDLMIYGTKCVRYGIRSWWNPMRWFKGIIYAERINPLKMYKK